MRVLVIGGGGREHAICKKLSESKLLSALFCVPGNAGIAQLCECDNSVSVSDGEAICAFAKRNNIDYVVVAPDNPLADGLVDLLNARGIEAFGPLKNAAEIESSKVFSKQLMQKYGIPTAEYREFSRVDEALAYIDSITKFPVVIKADGLAYGKGVIICEDRKQAINAIKDIMVDGRFGAAGNKLIIEEFLKGREVTVLCFTDGVTILPMESSQDHKRALDNDRGENTGGMGAFSPAPFYTPKLQKKVYDTVLLPTMRAMNAEGRTFKGVLYVGLMIDGEDVKVLEYNARFGDPETQAVLPRLKSDLLEIMLAVSRTKLSGTLLKWDERACLCVIAASEGYPASYCTGRNIEIDGQFDEDTYLYHSGTAADGTRLVTAGGRVLGLSALGADIEQARQLAYKNLKKISFEGMHYRTDIGIKK